MQETQVRFLDGDDPLEKEMATHSIFLPGESHGQRSLVGVGHDLATKTTAMDETQRSWLAPSIFHPSAIDS